MTTYLQDSGYFRPRFKEEGDTMYVAPGPMSHIKSVVYEGAPRRIKVHQRRHVKGRVLTPKVLNEIEKWTVSRLESRGYPCPKVKSRANAETGEVVVEIVPGPRQRVVTIKEQPVLHMNPGVPRRFDAFRIDKWYNRDLLTLTSRRIQTDGLLQSTYFTASCEGQGQDEGGGVVLEQKNFAGRPRIVSVGFGANTEGLVLVKASWKHTRLEDNASLFQVDGLASYKQQQVNISAGLYPFQPTSRWHIMPLGSVDHERESQFHFLSSNAGVAAAGSWDNQKIGAVFRVGPNFNLVDNFRGTETGLTKFLSLQSRVDLMSHGFEYYLTRPRTGFQVGLAVDLNNKNLLSDVTAQRVTLDGHYLYNLLGYDPPLLVFGVRGGLYNTFTKGSAATVSKLPPSYKYYLGGSPDLRGWGRRELPSEDGAFSAAYVSAEVRLGELLPGGFQPFVFTDAGIFGDQALRYQGPVYWSPGVGLRWESPIGMFRGTAARGLKSGGNQAGTKDPHWQYYVSFGEEF